MIGIEGALHPDLLLQVVFGEHLWHQVALFNAHAMLTGQNTTHLHAKPQDIGPERLGLLQLTRLVGVIKDQRVQVAVASVKDVRHAQPIFFGKRAHSCKNARQFLARNRAVHAVIVG